MFSLAGADWPEDFALLEAALRERLGLRVAPLVVNDALGALRGGSPDWTGVSVVSGTYNAIGARHPDGRVFHLGFWPDGAGGRHLARDGPARRLPRGARHGPARRRSPSARSRSSARRDAIGLLHAFTRRGGLEEHEADRLAPVVLDVADAGDEVAQAIVARKGRILGRQARACAGAARPAAGGHARSCSPAASSATRPTGSPTPTMAELPGAVAGPPPGAADRRRAAAGARPRSASSVDAATVAAGLPFPYPNGRSAAWAGSPSKA